MQSFMSKSEIKTLFIFGVIGIGGLVFLGVVVLTYAGTIYYNSNLLTFLLFSSFLSKIHF